MKSVPLILRDHRDDLWRRWPDAARTTVGEDYVGLIGSQIGERMVRLLTEDLLGYFEAEAYERPALLRGVEARITEETASRLHLGFDPLDAAAALQALRGAAVDVLIDALVLDEAPSFADTLAQLKTVDAFLDRLVCAAFAAA